MNQQQTSNAPIAQRPSPLALAQPRIITHMVNRRTGIERQRLKSTHHHGALYDIEREVITQQCPHEHQDVDSAILCAHTLSAKHHPLPV